MAEQLGGERGGLPAAVLDLVCSAVHAAVGTPDSVVELWAERGQMVPSVVDALRPRRARALLSDVDVVPDALRAVPGLQLGAMGGDETAQVVLGVLPWRWAPVAVTVPAPTGHVAIRDDPASVTVLQACSAMPQDGVAAIVAGLGFLARRGGATVGAHLERFGVHVTAVVPLPKRVLLPASAPGRVMLVLRRRPAPFRGAGMQGRGQVRGPTEVHSALPGVTTGQDAPWRSRLET